MFIVGFIAFYIQNRIPRESGPDVLSREIEMIRLQSHLPDGKPVLVGRCYRPPGPKQNYSEKIYEIMKKVSQDEQDVFLPGDFKMNWLKNYSPKKKTASVSSECGMTQVATLATRETINSSGRKTSTCIDHIY